MSNRPTANDFATALEAMDPPLPESYRKLLETQYAAPDHAMTARQMSEAVGYKNFNATNLNYGTLAKRICRQLGIAKQGNGLLVTLKPQENDEWLWIMHPEVAEALELLDWVGNSGSVILANSLKSAFKQFRENPQWCLDVKIRRERARQVRDLLSDPDEVELDVFNREVWQHNTGRFLIGESGERRELNDVDIEEQSIALDEGRVELHGNQLWGSGSKVFGPGLKVSLEQKTENVRSALHIFNDQNLSPLDKLYEAKELPGFGDNISTGLTMVFHPNEFAIYNKKSRGGVEKLGYGKPGMEEFQEIVAGLRERIEADDFIELDWFMALINDGVIKIEFPVPPGPKLLQPVQNTILFGPPGTGKTYSVQRRAVGIIESLPEETSEKEIAEKFREYRGEGRIEFVTFHPSFSYEEFVEGFRYDPEKKVPTLHDGVFKDICKRSINPHQRREVREGARVWKVSLGRADQPQVFERCVKNGEIAVGFLDENIEGCNEQEISRLLEEPENGSWSYETKSLDYFANVMSLGDYVVAFENQNSISAIGTINGEYRYEEEYEGSRPHVRDVIWLDEEVHDIYEMNKSTSLIGPPVYPLDKISLQDFVTLLPGEEESEDKPYVLIIDEINRGNISRIFGELITLLEPDKRRGANNELSTRLPYSGENFSVPRNLHIIGTMNTADRSIALLDVALRRRFEFEEMMPKVAVLEEHGVSETVCAVFEVLNARITALLDRDHRIGHSYFLSATSPEELHHALYRRVFPLLQEYFYNDPAQLRRLLGKYEPGENTGFVGEEKLDFGKDFPRDASVDEEPWRFHEYRAEELEDALRKTFRGTFIEE